jgi:hypothetical protein
LPSPSPDLSRTQPLADQLVVFTGKLSSLGRKDARALVMRLGGSTADEVNVKTTMLVVGAEGFGPLGEGKARDKSNKQRRAEELNGQGAARVEILTVERLCVLAGVPTPDTLKRQYYAMRDLLGRYRSLREDHLRYLVKCGVIKPVLRTNADTFFPFPDVASIKQANDELDQGATFRGVVRSLIAARQGQLTFDFRLDAAPAKILALKPRVSQAPRIAPDPAASRVHDTALAEEYFLVGSALDDGDDANLEPAAAAYR